MTGTQGSGVLVSEKRGVPEKLVRLVEATYHGASTVVRTTHGRTDEFPFKVGVHQGSGLSPFLFIVVLNVISEECRCGLPCELLLADDLAVVTDTEEELQRSWLVWQIGMESKGQKVNTGNTEVMVSSRRGTKANMKYSQGTSLRQVNKFKYLGVTISEEGGSEEAVRARISEAWGKWKDLSGVISDRKMPRQLKIKLYMTVIRPVLLYGADCWTVGKKGEQILEKTEMRTLRIIKGVTLRDKVKELGVNSIQEEVREMRLRWYGHMQKLEENNEMRAVGDMRVPGKRPRGRPRGRWMDGVRRDIQELRITPEDA